MKKIIHLLSFQSLLCSISISVLAQQQSDTPLIEEVVVTGTPGGAEIRKFDAGFAITNVDDRDIERFSPKSTADLLKTIPGIWAESSGGVAGANVFVRGFPSTGDAPFLTVQLEGAPIFPPPTLSFLENTTLFRIDETVERMEGLRGGPQSVQDNGQPGLTTNFILKSGGETTQGRVKYTTSDYDLQRFDSVLSGPLGDGLYYMIGGYITSSPGIRDAGYTAEQGHQMTVKLTKALDSGTLNLYLRDTDDHGTWYLPAALNVPGIDAEYTQVGTLNRQNTILVGANNSERIVDQGDGRGWDGTVAGMTFDLAISDTWTLSDSLNYTAGDADTVGLLPDGGAVNVGDLLDDPTLDPLAVVTGPLSGRVTGRAVADSAYIQRFGTWLVQKEIESFTNNLALTGDYERFDVTFGYYTATTSVDEFWSLGNQDYYVVESGGEIVDGIACNEPAIDSCDWNYDIDAVGDATNAAFYAAVTFDLTDRLTLDIGARNENHKVEYSVDEGLTGAVSKFATYDQTETSTTVGVNYTFSDNQGVFGRYSKGFKFPWFDDFRDNYAQFLDGEDLLREVTQYELGYKLSTNNLSAYLTFFHNEVIGDSVVQTPGQPAVTNTNEAYGVEIDARWFHDSGFSLGVNATVQETEITESQTQADEGNEAARQPPYQLRLTPGYDFDLGRGMLATVYGAYTVVDDRFADNGNTVVLEGYDKIDLGIILQAGDKLSFQLAVDNLSDEEGLTEGDPRNPAAPNGRFIMPRTVKFSIGYDF